MGEDRPVLAREGEPQLEAAARGAYGRGVGAVPEHGRQQLGVDLGSVADVECRGGRPSGLPSRGDHACGAGYATGRAPRVSRSL